MASSSHGSNVQSSSKEHKSDSKHSGLLCHIKYNNTLPDIPFDAKFLSYPFDPNRFVKYKPTTLEKNFKYELLTENDVGVNIDLINPDTYAIDYSTPTMMDPLDEKLLEEEVTNPHDSKRSKQHSKVVPWMRKTEYISSEFNRYGTQVERQETKLGYNIKKLLKEETLYRDRESQIKAINKTFDDVKQPVNYHYSKPGVYALQQLPVFPDFELWKYPFAQVIFDADPSPAGCSVSVQVEYMSQAIIRGMMDQSGEQFVAYFLPTADTMQKRKRDEEQGVEYVPDEKYDFKLAREYNWTVKNKASSGYEENYFFVFRNEGVFYNELETRVRLNRRRAKEGLPHILNSRLMVKHRELNEQEMQAQENRMLYLQPPQEQEEAEEAIEEVADAEAESEKGSFSD
ncbi:unnamed protein product [Soboliphyme baturini]|uniref:RNA polymerase II-associated factor 1 homolog n=1 Tax=Soboliphyme baturini TaxID=241478 RepID=A0A183IHZ8_9BILA|nr:unnamed protein product [Soboliphyme baturini]